MKKILLLIFSSFIAFSVSSQIVITEIMYNPPESGNDSLEFIEIYNNSDESINLNGYSFTEGVEHVIEEDLLIAAKSYHVFSVNAAVLMGTLGVSSTQWSSGALTNGGETITLMDAQEKIAASVTYSDKEPWATSPDGDGSSLEICNLNGNQEDVNNWNASTHATGVTIDGKKVLATPVAENSATCEPAYDYEIISRNFEFAPSDLTIQVGETIKFRNEEGFHNVNGSQETFPNNPESFKNGAPSSDLWEYYYTFNTEGKYAYQCDPHKNSMNGVITVESNVTESTISGVTQVDETTGIATKLGETVSVTGIVMSPNYNSSSGYSFIIQDPDDMEGINVYSENDLGYEVTMGDELTVTGEIGQYNGLLQIEVTGIKEFSGGNDLIATQNVKEFGENVESEVISLSDMSVVDPSAWKLSGNFNIQVTDGTKEYTVRIDGDVGFEDLPVPQGKFTITGVMGQFDQEEPFLEGYQLLPRFPNDIDPYVMPEPEYPEYEISDVIQSSSDGSLDSLGVTCTLKGWMIRENFRPNGYQVVITNKDNTAGITVFSAEKINNIEISSGDELKVQGKITQFKGNAQIEAVAIEVLSEGNALPNPDEVNVLNEDSENRYIRIVGDLVSLDTWVGDGSSKSYEIDVNGVIYNIRVDSDVPLSNVAYAPTSKRVEVTGVGGQFDNEAPLLEGYQIFPFEESDIVAITSTSNVVTKDDVEVYPIPFSSQLHIQSRYLIEEIRILDMIGSVVFDQTCTGNAVVIDTNHYSQGLFLVQIKTSKGVVLHKIVK